MEYGGKRSAGRRLQAPRVHPTVDAILPIGATVKLDSSVYALY
jgi:hypothetical protein